MKLTSAHTSSYVPSVSSPRGFARDAETCSSAISDLPFMERSTNLDHSVEEAANQNTIYLDQSQNMTERAENNRAPDSDLAFTSTTHNLGVDTKEPFAAESPSGKISTVEDALAKSPGTHVMRSLTCSLIAADVTQRQIILIPPISITGLRQHLSDQLQCPRAMSISLSIHS
jgi:hypothetical protein